MFRHYCLQDLKIHNKVFREAIKQTRSILRNRERYRRCKNRVRLHENIRIWRILNIPIIPPSTFTMNSSPGRLILAPAGSLKNRDVSGTINVVSFFPPTCANLWRSGDGVHLDHRHAICGCISPEEVCKMHVNLQFKLQNKRWNLLQNLLSPENLGLLISRIRLEITSLENQEKRFENSIRKMFQELLVLLR